MRFEGVGSHSGSARRLGALSAESLDLAVGVHLVVLEDRHLDLLSLVLDLLGANRTEHREVTVSLCFSIDDLVQPSLWLGLT